MRENESLCLTVPPSHCLFLASACYISKAMPLSSKMQNVLRYVGAVAAVGAATLVLEIFQGRVNPTTVALVFILVILVSATFLGRNPALLASGAAMLSFNYFFLPPFRTFTIADSQNAVAWAAFLLTAIVAGELSAYADRRAREADEQRRQISKLYDELDEAFEKASETEALRRSERLKSALLDAVTHDLRTPLTAIKASVTTLLENQDEPEKLKLDAQSQGEFLSVINEETDRLNNFIGDMVELARIEAGALNLENKWSAVPEIIQTALQRAEPVLQNFRVAVRLEENLPLIRVDSKALAEVLYNLLDNAAKFAGGKLNIEIAVRRISDERVEFAVSDEGRGVPDFLREKIFDKFFRAGQSSADEHAAHGSGLGLAIAKGIVEAHGGKIFVTDAANGSGGAKFVFVIPIGDEEDDATVRR